MSFRRCAFGTLGLCVALTLVTLTLLVMFSPPMNPPYLVPMTTRLLPLDYWHHRLNHPEDYEESGKNACAMFPSPLSLAIVSTFWQKVSLEVGNLNVYVGFWDERPVEPVVRVLAYAGTELPKLYCQIWYVNNGEPTTIEATHHPEPRAPASRVLSCQPPSDSYPQRPEAVTVVERPCDTAVNALNLLAAEDYGNDGNGDSTRALRDTLVVCLLLPQSYDVTDRLVEWLELVRMFGADEVYVFYSQLHPTVSAVLNSYSKGRPGGIVTAFLLPITPPPRDPRTRLAAVTPVCLYHGLARHDWVIQLELGEMAVPVRDGSWRRLIEREQRESPFDVLYLSQYTFTNATRSPAESTYMLARTTRHDNPDEKDFMVPAFLSSASVVSFSREHSECMEGACRTRYAGGTTARLHRYANASATGGWNTTTVKPDLTPTVEDAAIHQWRKNLTAAITHAHRVYHIQYLRSNRAL